MRHFRILSTALLMGAFIIPSTAAAQTTGAAYGGDAGPLVVAPPPGPPAPPASEAVTPPPSEELSAPAVAGAGEDSPGEIAGVTETGSSGPAGTAPVAAAAPAEVRQLDAGDEGSLPFTGMDAGIVGLAGLGFLALGFAMRRQTRGDRV